MVQNHRNRYWLFFHPMGEFGPHAHSEPPILLRTATNRQLMRLPRAQRIFSIRCYALCVQVSIVEQYQHNYRSLERGGADNVAWSSPEDTRENCQGWCKSWFYWGESTTPALPWWGKCYDAANSLNNIVVAIGFNQLIPPATKRMVNETQCNRTNLFTHMRYLSVLLVLFLIVT